MALGIATRENSAAVVFILDFDDDLCPERTWPATKKALHLLEIVIPVELSPRPSSTPARRKWSILRERETSPLKVSESADSSGGDAGRLREPLCNLVYLRKAAGVNDLAVNNDARR